MGKPQRYARAGACLPARSPSRLSARVAGLGAFLVAMLPFTAHAELRVYGMVSVGEAPYQVASDIQASTGLPQAGISVGYSARYLTPYAKAGLGYYYQGLFAEAYAGLQAGVRLGWLKPSLTIGQGIQSANWKRFNYGETATIPAPGTPETTLDRRLFAPFGFGARLDVFEKAYGEFEARAGGLPMLKVELGFRIL